MKGKDIWEVEMISQKLKRENQTYFVSATDMTLAIEKGVRLMQDKEEKVGEDFGRIECTLAKYLCTLDA